MKNITREEIPTVCPKCNAELKAYHSSGSITMKVCIEHCNGYEAVVTINHRKELKGDVDAIQLSS